MEGTNRRLMWHGMCLFLIGLLTGFAETHFTNMRMGLAAHLEGVMNGTFLVALGAVWSEVQLRSPLQAITYWTTLYGTYENWFVTITRCGFWYCGAFSNHRSEPQWTAMAGEPGHGWIPYCRHRNRRFLRARAVGPSLQSAGVTSISGNLFT